MRRTIKKVVLCSAEGLLRRLSITTCVGATALICTLAVAETVFDGLGYSEHEIRSLIVRHRVVFHSLDARANIPDNVFYRQAFLGVLSDAALLSSLPSADKEIIAALPGHEDWRFVHKDHAELSDMCAAIELMPDNPEPTIEIARAFDQSRLRREEDLNAHYAATLNALSAPVRQHVLDKVSASDSHITYATFSMGELAAENPRVAYAILVAGCENFSEQRSRIQPQSVLLKDQLFGQSISAGQQ